jgi:hypothetical protein
VFFASLATLALLLRGLLCRCVDLLALDARGYLDLVALRQPQREREDIAAALVGPARLEELDRLGAQPPL